MYTVNAYQNYIDNEVLLADPLKLVSMLYRGAVEAVRAARSCLRGGDILGRSRSISKASAILNELALGLDHKAGGDLSRNLAELYDYMQRKLNEANFGQVDGPMEEVERLLETLIEAWRECEQRRSDPVPVRTVDATSGPPSETEYRPLCMTA